MRVAVLASGRGSNFDALLASTRDSSNPAQIVVLISDRADAGATHRAAEEGIPVRVIDPGTRRGDWSADGVAALRAALAEHAVEAVCLAGFMRILPAEIVRDHAHRILNIHPSLLPAFPGLRAPRQALRAGVKVAGCTVHFVDEGVDTGPIILQAAVPVLADDDEDALAARILEQEHRVYPEALRSLAEDRIQIEGRRTRIAQASPRGG
ncbi:MAG: phosphoribosylglycinamide formyltransferase [Gemmatimonadetes bacterium]|nr:phosphoribosylglycinamide formyltransferase [Gemmatimonadota bacterium]